VFQVREVGIDELDAGKWNELLTKSEVCDAFQTYEWAEVHKNSMNARPRFLTIEKGRETMGGVLFFKKKLFRIFDVYEVRGGPLYIGKNKAAVMQSILKAFRRKKQRSVYSLFVPSPQINLAFKKIFEAEGYNPIAFRTSIIDLERSLEEIWSAIDKKARWGVRKAKRLGVEVTTAETLNLWKQYYDLRVLHSRKKHYPTIPFAFFVEMFNLQSRNISRLFVAKHNGRMIAGSLFLNYRQNMVFLQNSSLDAFLSYNPNNLIQWKSIEWAKQNGVTTYDINGLPWEGTPYLRGIYGYKKRWNGDIYWYNYYLNNKLSCSGIHLIRSSFLAWKTFSRLRDQGIASI